MTHRTLALGLLILILMAGCGRIAESRFNPLNWFGGDAEVTTLASGEVIDTDPRPLIEAVTDLRIERTQTGAIVRATGLAPVQGWYDAELVPTTEDAVPEGGVLTYTFRASPPDQAVRVSSPASREVVVATTLNRFELQAIREIRVVGRSNLRSVRR